SFAGGGYTGSAPRTGGLDGQGGFLAMLHPQETVVDHTGSRSTAVMQQYSPNRQQRQAEQVTPTFRLETTVINGVEYATVEQVRQMGAQASREGAQNGYNLTLKRLANAPSARRRIGI
ncbi:MAG: hypothetical protein ACO23G_10715, partial [Limnohabitans sp.]